MGTSLHSCVEVLEPIELSFGVVSGVGPGILVLDGGSRVLKSRGGFWGCVHAYRLCAFCLGLILLLSLKASHTLISGSEGMITHNSKHFCSTCTQYLNTILLQHI